MQLRFRQGIWRAGGDCLVEDVFVDASARGHGVARALLELATERALERGCRRMELDVNEENPAALALYTSFGFTTGEPRDLYMRRHLDAGPGRVARGRRRRAFSAPGDPGGARWSP